MDPKISKEFERVVNRIRPYATIIETRDIDKEKVLLIEAKKEILNAEGAYAIEKVLK